jgi:hypothetical protein
MAPKHQCLFRKQKHYVRMSFIRHGVSIYFVVFLKLFPMLILKRHTFLLGANLSFKPLCRLLALA